ncbi:MAG: class B sortase [Clostridia bacterium]|nr:class B sortase [Clostridia bacterium]
MKEKNNSKIKKATTAIIILILTCIMIFSGIKIIEWINENNNNKNIMSEISNAVTTEDNTENANKYNVDFASLKQKNSDTIAWLKVNGTEIEYPVVKTTNNDYYMTHSFDKSYNSSGWAFMDYKNKCDGTDKNMIIYGHNRRDGSMFATLQNILTEEWQSNSENFKIPFITENEKAEYQVFSVYKIEKENYYITTNFENNTEFQKFIDKIKSRSEKDFGIEVTENDNILTLSTCANDSRYRVVLHAKKII